MGWFTYFKDDDVIIAKITPCFENGKGALCRNLINGLGFGTTELHVLRAKNQVVRVLFGMLQIHGFRVMGEAMMQEQQGKRVPKDFIENFVVAFQHLLNNKPSLTSSTKNRRNKYPHCR